MTDANIELEAAKDPSLPAIVARLREQGVDPETAELRMGYTRQSTPLLGDVRAAAVIAVDASGRVGEVVHMPLDDLDPITLDEGIIERVLDRGIVAFVTSEITMHELAHQIVAALRAGTTTKES